MKTVLKQNVNDFFPSKAESFLVWVSIGMGIIGLTVPQMLFHFFSAVCNVALMHSSCQWILLAPV